MLLFKRLIKHEYSIPFMKNFVYIFLASIFLCSAGFFNSFPLVYPDTGAYIFSGFENLVLWDRPIFYGWFIRHVSLEESLFLVIFVQALMLSYLIFLMFKFYCNLKFWKNWYLVFILFLVLVTAISYQTSRLMPDIFTPIMILASLLLIFHWEDIPRLERVFLALIFIQSVIVHNSHLPIFVLGLGSLIIVKLLFRSNWTALKWKNILFASGIFIFSTLLMPTAQYLVDGEFKITKGAHVFMMSKLLEFGVIEDYLDNNCGEKDFKLCEYKDAIPVDFIWDYENSPLHKTGGWKENEEDYKQIIREVILTPKYFKDCVINAVEATVRQIFHFDVDDFDPQKRGTPPFGAIDKHLKKQIRKYEFAYQTRGKLEFSLINFMQKIVIYFSMLGLVMTLFIKKIRQSIPKELLLFSIALLLFCLANTFVCASLSAVISRYQNRVNWLFPTLLFLFITYKPVVSAIRDSFWSGVEGRKEIN